MVDKYIAIVFRLRNQLNLVLKVLNMITERYNEAYSNIFSIGLSI